MASKIVIKQLTNEQIPQELIDGLAQEAHGVGPLYTRYGIRKTTAKFGAFEGDKMIGFACAGTTLRLPSKKGQKMTFRKSRGFLDFTAKYVLPQYRKRGIAHRFDMAIASIAQNSGLKGVFFYDLNEPGKKSFLKMKNKNRFQGRLLIEKDGMVHGVLKFRRPK